MDRIRYGKEHQIYSSACISDRFNTICSSLIFFHSFTGCDSTSPFHNKGKVTAWKAWQLLPEVTDTFNRFSCEITEMKDDVFEMIEMFVVLLYSRTCNTKLVNEARRILFSQGNRQIENISPTKDALLEHLRSPVFPVHNYVSVMVSAFNPHLEHSLNRYSFTYDSILFV